MLRVVFVLRSTEVHPELFGLSVHNSHRLWRGFQSRGGAMYLGVLPQSADIPRSSQPADLLLSSQSADHAQIFPSPPNPQISLSLLNPQIFPSPPNPQISLSPPNPQIFPSPPNPQIFSSVLVRADPDPEEIYDVWPCANSMICSSPTEPQCSWATQTNSIDFKVVSTHHVTAFRCRMML